VSYTCYVRQPRSTYDFGIWAWSRCESPGRGIAAFEAYDGGFNNASEVVYADIVFSGRVDDVGCRGGARGDIRIAGFLVADFCSEDSSIIEVEINPRVLPLVVEALERIYPTFRVVPSEAATGAQSPMLESVRRLFTATTNEAELMRPMYNVLHGGADTDADGDVERYDDAGLCNKVRTDISKMVAEKEQEFYIFTKIARGFC
jgi:hypothetical protein